MNRARSVCPRSLPQILPFKRMQFALLVLESLLIEGGVEALQLLEDRIILLTTEQRAGLGKEELIFLIDVIPQCRTELIRGSHKIRKLPQPHIPFQVFDRMTLLIMLEHHVADRLALGMGAGFDRRKQ